MDWNTCNSNNERGLLKANGPYRLRTTVGPFTGVRRSQIIKLTEPIIIGEVKIYGTSSAKEDDIEKKDPMMPIKEAPSSEG